LYIAVAARNTEMQCVGKWRSFPL